MSLYAPPSSSAAAPHTTATKCATATRPAGSCPLLRLPDALYGHVLHFLPAEHKLNQLAHLCRRLTPLSPVAFHHSHLELSVAAVAGRPRELLVPSAALGVHSLTFDLSLRTRDDASAYATLMQRVAPPGPTAASHFACLRQLSLRLHFYNITSHSSLLSTLIPSAAALPVLSSLTLWTDNAFAALPEDGSRPNCCLALSALANLPALRHLTLCLPLHVDDFADVLSLRGVHTVSLCTSQRGDKLLVPQAVMAALPSLLSPSCRSLKLPTVYSDVRDTATLSSPESAALMMAQIARQAAGQAEGLQYLAVTGGLHDRALLLATAFPSLTALRVDSVYFQHDVAVALPACAGLPLLQHISVAVGQWATKTVWEHFLSQAGSRIRTAHLRELDKLPNARSTPQAVNEWIAMLLLHCTALESLELVSSHARQDSCKSNSGHPVASHPLTATLSSLASLHTLGLWGLHLDNRQVTAMLQACPLLEDCTLKTPSITAGMLAVLGGHCPLLRRVWLEGQGRELLGEEAAQRLLIFMPSLHTETAAAKRARCFERLRVLYIDWSAGGYHDHSRSLWGPRFTQYDHTAASAPLFHISHRLVGLLPSLLATAPLRYLHLPLLHNSSMQLLLFEPLHELRGLSLIGRPSRCFDECTQRNPYARLRQVGGVVEDEVEAEVWWDKASDRSMEGEPRMVQVWQRVFEVMSSSAGSDARAEFFDMLRKKLELDDAEPYDSQHL